MRPSKRSKGLTAPDITEIGRYLSRATSEPGVRDEARSAAQSLKRAYKRFDRAPSPVDALLHDRKLQRDLSNALKALQRAAVALTTPPKMRTRDRVVVAGVTTVLLIAAVFAFLRGRTAGSTDQADQDAPVAGTESPQSS
jgi:hypothetical protein